VGCVTWQVGPCRGALEAYGTKIFPDTRKNEDMNSANMQYLSIIVIDDNHQIILASKSFVFQETVELYGCAYSFTIDMSPGFLLMMYSLDGEICFCHLITSDNGSQISHGKSIHITFACQLISIMF